MANWRAMASSSAFQSHSLGAASASTAVAIVVLGESLADLHDLLTQTLAGQEVAPASVDDLALLVHHVVVLEQVLADVEVVCLDLRLRVARSRA